MAGGMDLGTSKGGKKPLDAQINLTPFIDLMAVTICFLIMTAVWTQIGRLQVSQQGQGGDPTEQDQKEQIQVTLTLGEKEIKLMAGPTQLPPIPIHRDDKGKLDLAALTAQLKEVKAQLPPDKSDITLQTEDNVRYEDLVRVIDECIGGGLPNVSVAAVTG